MDKYDLNNEGVPPSNTWFGNNYWNGAIVEQYLQYIWGLWIEHYGSSDTYGFSVACQNDCTSRIGQFTNVYGSTLPPVFDFHIYGQCLDPTQPTAYQTYLNAWNALKPKGWTQGWIIGETCYNNSTAASLLSSAQAQAGNTLFFLVQWPSTGVVPMSFNNYIADGF
jgi:hypothetical protein